MTDTRVTTEADAPAPAPFTMVPGAPGAMVCEGDVCYFPGSDVADVPAE